MKKIPKTKIALLCLTIFLSVLLIASNDDKKNEVTVNKSDKQDKTYTEEERKKADEAFLKLNYKPSSGKTWQAFPNTSPKKEEN